MYVNIGKTSDLSEDSPDSVRNGGGVGVAAARPILPRGDDLQVDVDVEDDEAERYKIIFCICTAFSRLKSG